MDGLQSLLLLGLLYFAPKIWRHFMAQESKNPQLPEQVLTPEIEIPSVKSAQNVKYQPSEPPALPVASHKEKSLSIVEEQTGLQGNLANNFVQGVIFAEILQPSRAYRPFRGRIK